MVRRAEREIGDLEPGSPIDVEGTRMTVRDVIYPLHPETGRALFRVQKPAVGVDYALKVFDLRGRRNLSAAVGREVIALNKTLAYPERFPKAHAFEVRGDWALMLLDWMDGVPLSQAVTGVPQGPADLRWRLRLLSNLAQTVSMVHRVRLLHRDIKPDNVILRDARDSDRGVALIDFGLAAEARSAEEGTPQYCAPEQSTVRYFNLTAAVDVFALGQVGAWLFTGAPLSLYADTSISDWDDFPLPALLAAQPGAPAELELVLTRALQLKPESRFRTAADLRHALARVRC